MSFKKIICLVFALALMVSALSACGGNSEKPASSNPSSGSNSGQGTVSAFAPSVEEGSIYADPNWSPYASMKDSIKGSTVRYAHWSNFTEDETAPSLKLLEEKVGIKVEWFAAPQDGYVNHIMTKMSSGDYPDVFITNEDNGSFPVTLQIAAPINKVTSIDLNDPIWDQGYLKSATINGNIYYLNTVNNPNKSGDFVYYNKRLFAENGFKSPADYYAEGTWTWDNLLNCAKDIKSLGEDYQGASLELDKLAASIGASITKYDFDTHTFSSGLDNPDLLRAYQWYADARSQLLLSGTQRQFIDGKCGIYIRSAYLMGKNHRFSEMNPDDIGYVFMPSFDEGKKSNLPSIYSGMGICVNAPNADAAGYFIRFWQDPTNHNLNDAYLTVDFGNFYFDELTTIPSNERYYNFDDPLMFLIGEKNANDILYGKINKSSSAAMKTTLDSFANIVDEACNKANELINNKIVEDLD